MWRTIRPAHGLCARAAQRTCAEDEPRTLIFSCLRDKPLTEMAQILFPLFEHVIVRRSMPRARRRLEDLLAAAKATGTPAIGRGVRAARRCGWRRSARAGGVAVVSGSVYLVGEARAHADGREQAGDETMSARPNPMPRLYRWRSNVLQTPVLAMVTAVCGSLALAGFARGQKRARCSIASRDSGRAVRCGLRGRRLTVVGAENLRKHPVAVYASNHTSYMDTPVIFAALPFQFRILAKKELWQWPFIGWYLNRSGQMPIDTENPHATLSSLGGSVKALRGGNAAVCFSRRRANARWRAETVPFRRGVSGDSRAECRWCRSRSGRLRSAADPHASLLSQRADAAGGRADRDQGNDGAANRRADGAAARLRLQGC